MADIKISELTQVSALNNGDLVEVSQVNALAPSGYTSLKASMTDLGKKVNADIEYTTELSDFADKTPLGAIKETAKDKNIADEYDGTQTYDKGDVVIYKNTLYICTTNNTTGTWDATKWTATTIDNVIGSLSSLTTTTKSSLVGAVNEVIATEVINYTASTTYLKNVSGFVHKTGKAVNVSITAQIKQQFNNTGSVLISGLPVPKDLAQVPLTAISGSANGQTNRIAVMTGGTVESYYSNNTLFPVDAYVLFSFTYFAKDM